MLTLTENRVLQLGTRGLTVLVATAISATWLLAWVAPQYVILVPIAGILVLLGMLAHDQPLVPLFVILMASVVNIGGAEGIELPELLYGIGVVIYLGIWYVHAFLTGKRFVRSRVDQAWTLWLLWACIGGAVLGPLFGADPNSYRGELQLALLFFFYFPIKEAIRTEKWGLLSVLMPALFMGVWITIFNGLEMQQSLQSAEAIGQIMGVREVTGKYQMTMAAILSLALASVSKSRWLTALLLSVVALSVGGIILAKFRSIWVAGLLGIVLVWFALNNKRAKRTMAWYTIFGGILLALVTLILFKDATQFIFLGVAERFGTFAETGNDLSLLNRFAEWTVVWKKTLTNPVVGYGWGVPFEYHSPIDLATLRYSFIHNAYLSVLYKHGLVGLSIILFIWGTSVIKCVFLSRQQFVSPQRQALAAGLFGLLCVYAIVSITSNTFMKMDQVLNVVILFALVEGLLQRYQAGGTVSKRQIANQNV